MRSLRTRLPSLAARDSRSRLARPARGHAQRRSHHRWPRLHSCLIHSPPLLTTSNAESHARLWDILRRCLPSSYKSRKRSTSRKRCIICRTSLPITRRDMPFHTRWHITNLNKPRLRRLRSVITGRHDESRPARLLQAHRARRKQRSTRHRDTGSSIRSRSIRRTRPRHHHPRRARRYHRLRHHLYVTPRGGARAGRAASRARSG